MASIIYALCALTSVLCAWLLLRSYARRKYNLLLWSGLCFVGLSVNNLLLVLDRLIFLGVDLSMARLITALCAMLLLLYGLISEKT